MAPVAPASPTSPFCPFAPSLPAGPVAPVSPLTPEPVPVASIVIVCALLSAVIVALAPAINVNWSAATFATTLLPPCTDTVLNASLTLPPPPPEPVLEIVIVSVFASEVIEIPLPAAMFNVSWLLSATIVFCPLTAIFLNTPSCTLV